MLSVHKESTCGLKWPTGRNFNVTQKKKNPTIQSRNACYKYLLHPIWELCNFIWKPASLTPNLFHSLAPQGSTLTFQVTGQVASDILDVTTISVCLLVSLAKLTSGN